MIFQNSVSQGNFAVVICFVTVVICSSVIYIGVNLVAILNWNMKDAIVLVVCCAFLGWSF